MKIKALTISNFKSIKILEMIDLPNMVVIAGPNGSGKTTIFDAIRLLKSVYGGYQQNEYQQWFNEFQIGLDKKQTQWASLFQDSNSPIKIAADFSILESEKKFLKENLDTILRPYIWNQVVPDSPGMPYRPSQAIASQLRQYGEKVEEQTKNEADVIIKALESTSVFSAELIIPKTTGEGLLIKSSPVLQLIFSLYLPSEIGVIDYHGPQRTYQREQIGGVNLSIETTEQKSSQNALYNYANKYTNIKSEMASSFIREVLAEKAGFSSSESQTLIETLQELFTNFFPGKHFDGIVPTKDGGIRFPVSTDSGIVHDINDLSSGEKEVLYGYLRIYNLSPHRSVLLIDEPELHLNPRLVQGLPQFYQKHLGKPLDNQIWLLTHSDAMLREALITENTGVFHMLLPETIESGTNQLRKITLAEEVEKAIIDLVGDLATYKPGSKVIIFEGGGDTDFDIYMVSTLFPEISKTTNLIHGSNKIGVNKLHSLLEDAQKAGVISAKVFSIVDKDADEISVSVGNHFAWDVYHIENYLLEIKYIDFVLQDIQGGTQGKKDTEELNKMLQICASDTMNSLISHDLNRFASKAIINSIDLSFDPHASDLADSLSSAIQRTKERIDNTILTVITNEEIKKRESLLRTSYLDDLQTGKWKSTFRGREVLKRFCGRSEISIKYEVFRNLIIAKMRDMNYKPEGMRKILEGIVNSK